VDMVLCNWMIGAMCTFMCACLFAVKNFVTLFPTH